MIILFGSTGYIGSEFKRQLEELKLPFFCWPNSSKTTFADLEKWYDDAGYPFIGTVINAAGYTGKPNVDACEQHKQETIHGNVVFPLQLEAANPVTPVVHITSGCVYTGYKAGGWTEEDAPNFDFNNGSF